MTSFPYPKSEHPYGEKCMPYTIDEVTIPEGLIESDECPKDLEEFITGGDPGDENNSRPWHNEYRKTKEDATNFQGFPLEMDPEYAYSRPIKKGGPKIQNPWIKDGPKIHNPHTKTVIIDPYPDMLDFPGYENDWIAYEEAKDFAEYESDWKKVWNEAKNFEQGPKGAVEKGTNPKDIIGTKKVDLSVIPPAGEIHLALAMVDGANKYGPFNWRGNKVQARVYYAAARRHLMSWLDGEDYVLNEDGEIVSHHLGNVMACCAILLDAEATGNLLDNRPVKGKASALLDLFTKKK